jgi:putative (di)nucleoside polyphosphate hydrolase
MRLVLCGNMTDSIDVDGFRANVGIVLIRDDRQVFLGGRSGGRGWQFPQGGILQGESPEQALYRELHEEIGLERGDVELLATTRNWLRYRLPKQYVRRNSQPQCIGQKQRWFLLRFRASEDRFRFDSTGEPEFENWRWVDYWTPVREVIFFKRAVYVRALDELANIAFPGDSPALPDWAEQEKNLRNLARKRAEASSASGA